MTSNLPYQAVGSLIVHNERVLANSNRSFKHKKKKLNLSIVQNSNQNTPTSHKKTESLYNSRYSCVGTPGSSRNSMCIKLQTPSHKRQKFSKMFQGSENDQLVRMEVETVRNYFNQEQNEEF